MRTMLLILLAFVFFFGCTSPTPLIASTNPIIEISPIPPASLPSASPVALPTSTALPSTPFPVTTPIPTPTSTPTTGLPICTKPYGMYVPISNQDPIYPNLPPIPQSVPYDGYSYFNVLKTYFLQNGGQYWYLYIDNERFTWDTFVPGVISSTRNYCIQACGYPSDGNFEVYLEPLAEANIGTYAKYFYFSGSCK